MGEYRPLSQPFPSVAVGDYAIAAHDAARMDAGLAFHVYVMNGTPDPLRIANVVAANAESVEVLADYVAGLAGTTADSVASKVRGLATLVDFKEREDYPADRRARGVNTVETVKTLPLSSVEAFPLGVLPPVAAALVVEGAAALDCPSDLLVLPLLCGTAGVIGNRVHIELKPGYVQRAILWGAVIAEPGSAKSPAQAIVHTPLDVLQRDAHERRKILKEEYQHKLDRWQSEDKAIRGTRPEPPLDEEHFFTTDSTAEGVAKMLGGDESSTPGFVINRDELSGWVQSFDRYSKGADRQTWLSAWAGASFKSDRAGRDSIFVPDPTISVSGGIQPDVLPSLAPESGQRDGFIERFLFAFPDTKPMRWTDGSVRQSTVDALTDAYRKLRSAREGAVRLTPEALALFRQWVDENADLQAATTGLVRGYYAKLPNQAARIALVLHCLTYPSDPAAERVCGETMQNALTLTEYFRSHAHRTFAAFGVVALVQHPLAHRAYAVLEKNAGQWLSSSALRAALGGHLKADEFVPGMTELVRAGLAETRPMPPGDKGGRPGQEWRKSPSASTVLTALTPKDDEEVTEWAA